MPPSGDRRQFASDNYAGICPEAWEAMERANNGHAPAYGEDAWTARASDLLREIFEIDCEVFFTFNGTAANSLALAALCRSYHSVICHELAHVETDECGGPEFFSNGTKVLLVPGGQGKVDVRAVDHAVTRRRDIHYPKPRVLSITQATELGTVYAVDELRAVAETARCHNLRVHMDGSRFANAVATLGVTPKDLTWKVGVDVLCFGGTKNGMAVGEAVVFFDRALAEEFAYRCKQAGQLASKMRFLAAPWVGMLEDGAWLRHAAHANARARQLEAALRELAAASTDDGSRGPIEILHPVQANSVFVRMPQPVIDTLRSRGWKFYSFIGSGGCRLMCSWDTTAQDVTALVDELRSLIGRQAATR